MNVMFMERDAEYLEYPNQNGGIIERDTVSESATPEG
jgi:hypothetical protein